MFVITQPEFPMGLVVMTRNAHETLIHADVLIALIRHSHCDWGELCPDDTALNNLAVKEGGRMLSVYTDSADTRFWIITEADRSATTILLPEDY